MVFFSSDYGGRRHSEDFSPTDEEWAVTKANSLRLKKHAHHNIKHYHLQPQQPQFHHVIKVVVVLHYDEHIFES